MLPFWLPKCVLESSFKSRSGLVPDPICIQVAHTRATIDEHRCPFEIDKESTFIPALNCSPTHAISYSAKRRNMRPELSPSDGYVPLFANNLRLECYYFIAWFAYSATRENPQARWLCPHNQRRWGSEGTVAKADDIVEFVESAQANGAAYSACCKVVPLRRDARQVLFCVRLFTWARTVCRLVISEDLHNWKLQAPVADGQLERNNIPQVRFSNKFEFRRSLFIGSRSLSIELMLFRSL